MKERPMKEALVGDIRLAYRDEGTGQPILLIHGFPFDHTMWDAQVSGLSGRRRVLAPDLRGFGRSVSGAEPTAGETVTMDRFADDLAGLLEALAIDEPVAVAGLSMGGYIALAFWRKYRDRTGALLLCDTKAKADPPMNAELRLKAAAAFEKEGMDAAAEEMPRKLFSPTSLETKPEAVESIRAVIRRTRPPGAAAANRGMARRRDMESELSRIEVPVLLIVGEDDSISPPDEMAAMAARIPGAQFETIPNSGHLTPLENPEAFNARVAEFLGIHYN